MAKITLTYKVYYNDDAFVAQVEVDYHVDTQYGADSDGRRGILRTFVDDVHILEILDESGEKITYKNEALEHVILAAVDEHL